MTVANLGPAPEGLRYVPDFLGKGEAAALLEPLSRVPFRAFQMRGQAAKRTVAHYGWDYAYDRSGVLPGPPVPGFLLDLKARCEALADLPAGKLEEVLVTCYPPGAGIGWHQDAPAFGSAVVGVSLGAPARMRFRPTRRHAEVYELWLEPGSAYVLSGKARWSWQHMLPPVKALRYSVTFRSVRSAAKAVESSPDQSLRSP